MITLNSSRESVRTRGDATAERWRTTRGRAAVAGTDPRRSDQTGGTIRVQDSVEKIADKLA